MTFAASLASIGTAIAEGAVAAGGALSAGAGALGTAGAGALEAAIPSTFAGLEAGAGAGALEAGGAGALEAGGATTATAMAPQTGIAAITPEFGSGVGAVGTPTSQTFATSALNAAGSMAPTAEVPGAIESGLGYLGMDPTGVPASMIAGGVKGMGIGALTGGIGSAATGQDVGEGMGMGALTGAIGGAGGAGLSSMSGAGGVAGKIGQFAAAHDVAVPAAIGMGANAMLSPMMADSSLTAPGIQYPNIDPNKFKYTQPQWSVYQPKYYAGGGITDLDAGDGVPSVQMMAIGGDVRKMADSLAKNSMFGFDSASDIPLIGGLFQKPEEIPQMATLTPEEKQKLMAMMEAKQSGQVQPIQPMQPVQNMARGGISDLGSYSDGGHLLKGPGDGVSDDIPAQIGGKQPARLADGEFVVPARIVSELGNGSTDAGARRLYQMMDRINSGRAATTKKGKFAEDTKAYKHLPA